MAAQQSNQLQGDEPPMYLQRPSSARSQDITHVLARTFRQLFTRDAVGPDTVHYLNKSRGGDDEYHERYVEALRQVQDERDHRMAEAAMLERHIMQAQARAMSADERELNRVSSGFQRFPDLGLPPARSHFRSCIDSDLLRKHNLITPDDFSTEEVPVVPAPQASPVPNYARNTVSNQCRNDGSNMKVQTPLPNIGDSFNEHLMSTSDLSSCSTNLPSAREKPLTSTNDLWKKQIGAETREEVRREVANMQARVDFLKNPRHGPPSAHVGSRSLVKGHKKVAKEFGAKPLPEPERKETSVIFVASPPVLTFTEYTVGNVYELTLELKNVTSVLRPVRVIPPKSSYFSVGLGQFPGDQGLVAPGMSCHYTVRFAPDSLGDFDDTLTVQTQSSTPLVIAIQGRRPPPALSLPEQLDIGECLVGGCKVTRLLVRNDGGPGRFCMMNRTSWPATNFKSIVASGFVSLSAFEIRPAVFELNRGQTTTIEILFSPTQVESHSETMTMVCDNCQVKHFSMTGMGQVAEVEISSVEDGLANALPGEVCDVSAQHLIRFDNLNPYTYTQREVEVLNKTNVEMPYNWVIVKPLLVPPKQPEAEPDDHSTQERIQDVETPFVIEPSSGILAAGTTTKFTVTFAPPEVKEFQSVLHMILRDIPRPPVTVPFPEDGDGQQSESDGVAELVLPPSDNGGIQDMTALQIEVKGQCEEFKVMLQPYAVYIPGQILVETPVKKMFRMINGSVSAINFEWEKLSTDHILEVEPPFGELGSEQELDFELTVCGSRPGKINHTLLCHVQHLREPVTLYVEAEIKGPEVVIDNPDLNFGLVRLGHTMESSIVIRNTSQISAKWSLRESNVHSSQNNAEESEFQFCPSDGELRPLEDMKVLIRFTPYQCRSLRTLFELNVADGNESALAVRAEVQNPTACLLACEVTLSDVYLEVPFMHTIKLLNQTMLPTKYEWGELEGEDSEFCSVSVEPKSGDLAPREELALSLYFTAHKHCELEDLKLPCWVEGMSEPVILSIRCDVKGLGVTYRTQSGEAEPSEDLMLDFGSGVPLGENRKCYLYIKNNSAITAPFSINVEHFYAKPPTPPDGRPDAYMPSKSQRRALLGKTPNLADPLSKTPAKAHADQLHAKMFNELCKTMLRGGRGASFTVHPAAGSLQPFSEEMIELTSFCDMWGEYTDQLVCTVENLDPVHIPMKLGVTGSPLNFQIVAQKSGQKPILRFGTHVSGVAPVTRQMRINNSSPVDIRLDWQTFNMNKSDSQLLDMVVNFGEIFPLLDPQGNQIQPGKQRSVSGTQRQPTGIIPNTPDTTPAASRENNKPATTEESMPSTARSIESRPKVISLTLREHGGTESSDPYMIKPSQVVVPARGNTCLNVSFTPFPTTDVSNVVDCLGFALGYASLEGSALKVDGKVNRKQHFDVAPLRLDMTAQVKPALLTIECRDDDTMHYRAAASDLMQNGQIVTQSLKMCSAVLSNQTETPLVFRLLSSEPFQIVYTDPETQTPILQLLQTEMASLNPRQNMLVQVGFRISLELLESISCWNEENDEEQSKTWELEMNGQERRIQFTDQLTVEFNNKSIQKLPLTATLILPSLVINKESIDFGTCLVGQAREMQFSLENPSASASYWAVTIESKSESCADDTFIIEPNEGFLEPFITHVSASKTLIKVFFTAKHTEDYEAVFLVQGLLGEEPRRLQLLGSGSYDGKHEALVNV